MSNISSEETKILCRDKLNLAIENLKQAELEGAEQLTPHTYRWAKQKIYKSKKIILKYPNEETMIENASEDATSAAAQLLSIVSEYQKTEVIAGLHNSEKEELEAIKEFANEGGPVI